MFILISILNTVITLLKVIYLELDERDLIFFSFSIKRWLSLISLQQQRQSQDPLALAY